MARALRSAGTASASAPKMNMLSAPISSAISMLAPSMVPMMSAPFIANFMLPVPLASVPAVEMCWLRRSAVGQRHEARAGRKAASTSSPLRPPPLAHMHTHKQSSTNRSKQLAAHCPPAPT